MKLKNKQTNKQTKKKKKKRRALKMVGQTIIIDQNKYLHILINISKIPEILIPIWVSQTIYSKIIILFVKKSIGTILR